MAAAATETGSGFGKWRQDENGCADDSQRNPPQPAALGRFIGFPPQARLKIWVIHEPLHFDCHGLRRAMAGYHRAAAGTKMCGISHAEGFDDLQKNREAD
ncbi:MAG: hypothetical protein ACLQIQ_11905 [Beijerinckiaceae bacterium]